MNTDTAENRNYTVWNQNRDQEPLRPRRLHTPVLFYVSMLLTALGTAALLAIPATITIDFWLAGLAVIVVGVAALVLVNQYLYARIRRRHSNGPASPPALKIQR